MSLVSNAELREKLDAKQDAKVIKWLNDNRIRWTRDAKGRAVTTIEAINQALLRNAEDEDEVSFG
jgi:hypothetical protein